MEILFVMQHTGYIRNYEPVILELAQRGHAVRLAFNSSKERDGKQNEGLLESVRAASPNITADEALAPRRAGGWEKSSVIIRTLRDCLRYLTPRYKNAHDLRARIFNRFTKIFGTFGRALPLTGLLRLYATLSGNTGVRLFSGALRRVERFVPVDPRIHAYIADTNPDILLVTPLIDFASPQVDYIKSARALGIPCALCVHSWDNLTNKGLIHVPPDRVIVWNEAQKKEAIEMHDVAAQAVLITGAQCYDKWFERRPSRSREQFLADTGLPASSAQVITYLCSSPFIAPDEVGFVMRWIESLRAHEQTKNAAILIRPHPQNARQWEAVNVEQMSAVSIWPRAGANPINDQAKNDFYDSMYFADAVVGINTSAMIESGTLGKAVFTILDDQFKGTQEGTLHFHHLVEGGLLNVANDLPRHVEQMAEVLRDTGASREQVLGFIRSFVRPHGLEKPCTPFVADAIESLASLKTSSVHA